jgi:hypothetical protein
MNLRIEFADFWPALTLIGILVVALTLMFLSSVMRNEITRLKITFGNCGFWIETKRSPKGHADLGTTGPKTLQKTS